MPTVLKQGPYRFFFYASDRDEPEHIHVEREGKVAKWWINPVRLQRSGGFARAELLRIERVVMQRREEFMEAWHAYFYG